MATRKKKKIEAEKFDEQVVMKEEFYDLEPKVVKGNHLTVTTFPNGSTKLEWDDAALLQEVKDAILSAELAAMKPAVRAKIASRKKKEITT
jgi:hypothetical protein